jgi:hypothetical protein
MLEMVLFNSRNGLIQLPHGLDNGKRIVKFYFLEIVRNVDLMMTWRSSPVCFIWRPVFMILEINVTIQLSSSTKHINIVSTLPLRHRRRWEDNIKMDLQEVGGGCGDWMVRAQDRDRWRALVSTVMNFRVP